MFDFANLLSANPNGVLASRSGEAVKTRVFQCLFSQGQKVFFCTSREKEVYKQLAADQNISFCAYPSDFSPVVSISGKTVFSEDPALKARALNENPMIKEIYKSPDNPIFVLFYLEVEEVKTFSFADGTKTYRL